MHCKLKSYYTFYISLGRRALAGNVLCFRTKLIIDTFSNKQKAMSYATGLLRMQFDDCIKAEGQKAQHGESNHEVLKRLLTEHFKPVN